MSLRFNTRVQLSIASNYLLYVWSFIWTLYSFVILNRFIFSNLKFESFGRIWHYFLSYQNFGFIRRLGLGSMISLIGLQEYFKNPYHTAYFLQNLFFSIFILLIYKFVSAPGVDKIWKWIVPSSPVVLSQAAYATGSTHLHQLILFLFLVQLGNRPILFSLVSLFGVLVHEIFIVLALSAVAITLLPEVKYLQSCKKLAYALMPACALIIYFVSQRTAPDVFYFENQVARLIPAAVGKNALWSGYFELFSSIGNNLNVGINHLYSRYAIFILMPAAYLILLASRFYLVCNNRYHFVLILTLAAMPILFSLLATDVYRWFGYACFVLICAIVKFQKVNLLTDSILSRRKFMLDAAILAFFVFSPFGVGILNNPLPIHGFLFR